MNDDLAGQGFRLLPGYCQRRLQIADFGIAPTRGSAFALAVPTKVEQQDIVARRVFEGSHGTQVRTRDAIAVADNDCRGSMWLCPEVAAQQFAIGGTEEQRTAQRGWRLLCIRR